MKKTALLFVCMGNICRSPTAHGVMAHLAQSHVGGTALEIDSAGTHNYHPGSAPDPRSLAHAKRRGYDLSGLRARQVVQADFEAFDLILAMDHDNVHALRQRCPPALQHKIRRLTEWCTQHRSETVPDPYYGDARGFDEVLDLVEDACENLLHQLRQGTLKP